MPKTKPKPDEVDLPAPPDLVEISFKDKVFTVPKDRDLWSMDSELALYQARATNLSHYWVQWVELGLGASQWQELTDVMSSRGDLVAFTKVFVETVFSECTG